MKLTTILCQVTDMRKAVGFYEDVLGLKSTLVTPNWSQFDLDGITLGLHPKFRDDSVGSGSWVVGLETSDLVALKETLLQNRVFVGEYHEIPGGVVLDFKDPDGNPIQAVQRGLAIASMP